MRSFRPNARFVRKGLTGLAVVLALGGTGLVAYPFATDLWAERIQTGLSSELAASVERYELGQVGTGEALTQLEIPKLDVDVVVVEGTTPAALRAGAGHYPDTPLPGEAGNIGIAGHRTTYGKPFSRLDELVAGDRIVLTTPVGRHVYVVEGRPWTVDAADWSPIEDYPPRGSWLTLTTCHPEGSAEQRLVVRAKMTQSSSSVAFGTETG